MGHAYTKKNKCVVLLKLEFNLHPVFYGDSTRKKTKRAAE